MSVSADKKLPQEAQEKIASITAQAQTTGDWAAANQAANAVRSQYGANYTASSGGATIPTSTISSYKSGTGYNANTDYGTQIQDLISSGGSTNDVLSAYQSRLAKSTNNSSLSQYANDSIMQAALDYIANNSKQTSFTMPYADQLSGITGQITNGSLADYLDSEEGQSLISQYKSRGQSAMQNTLGQVAARTGGLASSYATTAAGQTYNDYMSQLQEAAQEMYSNKKSDLYNQASLLQSLDNSAYQQYLDEQSNTSSTESATMATLKDQAETLAAYGDFSGYKALGYTDAQIANMNTAYKSAQAAAAAKTAASTTKATSSTSKSSSGSSSGSTGLTAAQAQSAIKSGTYTSSTLSAYDKYYGDGAFLQYLEGSDAHVADLTGRIGNLSNARKLAAIKEYYSSGYYNSTVYAYLLDYYGLA